MFSEPTAQAKQRIDSGNWLVVVAAQQGCRAQGHQQSQDHQQIAAHQRVFDAPEV
jgi:hypothetical protein